MVRWLFLLFLFSIFVFGADIFLPIKNVYYDAQKAKLGKKLFFDTRLSSTGRLSCEHCHNLYWKLTGTTTYNVNISADKQINPPTILNAALNYIFFSNGSVRDIRKQVEVSLLDLNQLGSSKEFIINKVTTDPSYESEFKRLYKGVTFDNIVDALVNFENALITPNSKFDAFLQGDANALTDDQKKGFELFKNMGCSNCHSGVNIGSNLIYNRAQNDYEQQLKVPTLRNITKTAPYFYDGKEMELKDVIKSMNFIHLLSDSEVDFMYKFLDSLTGQRPEILNEN